MKKRVDSRAAKIASLEAKVHELETRLSLMAKMRESAESRLCALDAAIEKRKSGLPTLARLLDLIAENFVNADKSPPLAHLVNAARACVAQMRAFNRTDELPRDTCPPDQASQS